MKKIFFAAVILVALFSNQPQTNAQANLRRPDIAFKFITKFCDQKQIHITFFNANENPNSKSKIGTGRIIPISDAAKRCFTAQEFNIPELVGGAGTTTRAIMVPDCNCYSGGVQKLKLEFLVELDITNTTTEANETNNKRFFIFEPN